MHISGFHFRTRYGGGHGTLITQAHTLVASPLSSCPPVNFPMLPLVATADSTRTQGTKSVSWKYGLASSSLSSLCRHLNLLIPHTQQAEDANSRAKREGPGRSRLGHSMRQPWLPEQLRLGLQISSLLEWIFIFS